MPAKKKSKRNPSPQPVEEAKIELESQDQLDPEEINYWQTVAKPQWERELKSLLAKPLPVAAYKISEPVLPVGQDR